MRSQTTGSSKANGAAATASAQQTELLHALQAVRSGDFSVRLPGDRIGIDGKIADTFNEIVVANARMAAELKRVGHVVGKKGQTSQRVRFEPLGGEWSEMESSINVLIDDLLRPTTEVTRAISAVAQGDLLRTVPLEVDGRPLEGEFLRSASIVNTMIQQLVVFTSEVTRVAREAGTDGKLGGQAQVIRGHLRFHKTAIILVSGVLVEDVDRLRGYDSGAVDYISVPIVPEILKAKVSVFAELYRKTEALQQLNQELERRAAERTSEIEVSAARLRESEARLRFVLTAATVQGWAWDVRKNEFSWVGPAESERWVQSFGEFLTQVHPADRATVQEAFNRALGAGEEYRAEFRTEEAGEEQWWLGRGTLIRDSSGQALSIAGVNIRITDRKRAEEERAILLRNAEEARPEAEKVSQLKDEFLATVSHELRTPLNAITGWAHMLRAGGLDGGAQAKAIETINRNALLQTRLISDLLDVSRIVSGKLRLDFKRVDLCAVIQAVLDTVRPDAEAKNIQIDVSLEAEQEAIAGDPARLQQVVWNLLSNAVKFTPAKGRVEVRSAFMGRELELTVEDDGPGIRPEILPYIFERFRQGDSSTTRAHQGLGLGVAIVRHLVEMHGGSVRAMNREDRSGAIFKVVLPVSLSLVQALGRTSGPLSPAEGSQEAASLPKGTRVLVVEDEADAREVAAFALERWGADVLVAASAGEAFHLLTRERPDVLVADIQMPGEDGYSLIQRVRGLPPEQGGRTPAVALTAYASVSDRARVLEAGFNRHVPKPVRLPDLLAAVAALVRLNAEGRLETASMKEASPALKASASPDAGRR